MTGSVKLLNARLGESHYGLEYRYWNYTQEYIEVEWVVMIPLSSFHCKYMPDLILFVFSQYRLIIVEFLWFLSNLHKGWWLWWVMGLGLVVMAMMMVIMIHPLTHKCVSELDSFIQLMSSSASGNTQLYITKGDLSPVGLSKQTSVKFNYIGTRLICNYSSTS